MNRARWGWRSVTSSRPVRVRCACRARPASQGDCARNRWAGTPTPAPRHVEGMGVTVAGCKPLAVLGNGAGVAGAESGRSRVCGLRSPDTCLQTRPIQRRPAGRPALGFPRQRDTRPCDATAQPTWFGQLRRLPAVERLPASKSSGNDDRRDDSTDGGRSHRFSASDCPVKEDLA